MVIAIDEYLKTAAANLIRASAAKRDEVGEVRNQAENLKREINQQINQIQDEIKRKQAEKLAFRGSQMDSRVNAIFIADRAREVSELKKLIDQKRQDIQRIDTDTKRIIGDLEQISRSLEGEAHMLESRTA